MNLDDIRKNIDKTDEKISKLLIERMQLSEQVGVEKAKNQIATENKGRENEVLYKVTKNAPKKFKPYIKDIYQTIFKTSKDYQNILMGKSNKYCVIGKKLSHSLSPEIHTSFGLDYVLNEIASENNLEKFFKVNPFNGFNVTIPYKKAVMPYLDGIDDLAKEIGAVNTIVKKDGKYFGYNTDYKGLKFALDNAGINLLNKVVMILGSGGASQTARYLAKSENAKKIIVVSRSGKINYKNCYDIKDTQIIINTTPVGMYPKISESPIDLEKFQNVEGVFDLIYNPLKTKLLLQAEKIGIKNSNGLVMLIAQAKFARDIFYGNFIDDKIIFDVFNNLICKFTNIIIIGMPSSGKTTVGINIAKKLGREFIDTDERIIKQTGMSIPNFFKTHGEKEFRKIEHEIILDLAHEHGKVIATGGGAILNQDNVEALKQNGKIFWIMRNLDELSTENRPLSKDKQSILKLWSERKGLYVQNADCIIMNKCINYTIIDLIKRFYADIYKKL